MTIRAATSRRAGREPCGIGAQIARLPALQNRSGKFGDAAEQPGRAAEDGLVDNPAEQEVEKAISGLTTVAP